MTEEKNNELKMYTLTELENILSVSHVTLLTYVKNGKLKAKKIMGKWRVKETDLKDFLGE